MASSPKPVTDGRPSRTARLDAWSRELFAGLGLDELRALLRGEDPTERPNPRYRAHVLSMLLHIRPRYYAAASTRLTYTFRLGFFSVFLLAVEAITGVLLMLYYVPTPESAYRSILRLNSLVPYGELLRDVHRLAGEAMVVVVVLHLLRTFVTASYRKERRFTWFTGGLLLLITLLFAFTGYLLPWDQLSYWAVTIGTSMAAAIPAIGETVNLALRGGPEIGADGLLRFYQLHVIFLPLLTVVLLSVHYYRVARIHSISLPPSIEEGDLPEDVRSRATRRINLIPDLLVHEWFLIALGVSVLLFLALRVYDAPLEGHANPLRTPLETQAPWFFLWVQGLLKLGDKTVWGVLVPGALALLLLVLPYLDRKRSRLARRRLPELALAVLALAILVVLSYMGTSRFGISFQPATRVAQAFGPDEDLGLVHQVAYDDLPVGVYALAEVETARLPADFAGLLVSVRQQIGEAFRETADPPQAWIVVEQQQVDLKQVTLRLQWLDEDGVARSQERVVDIHRLAEEAPP